MLGVQMQQKGQRHLQQIVKQRSLKTTARQTVLPNKASHLVKQARPPGGLVNDPCYEASAACSWS